MSDKKELKKEQEEIYQVPHSKLIEVKKAFGTLKVDLPTHQQIQILLDSLAVKTE